ncbi:hypothetical protein AAFF_G00376650 [Aldrovandia affinis]|uniref:Uncharacterized protein n=1 Tax=Aldrovandia affinis TaxID=143900 RepID=A0AAD7SFN0_9TELE|nr:hypothetical protein AAFF_G00376650 [Aldrovandia affinis]
MALFFIRESTSRAYRCPTRADTRTATLRSTGTERILRTDAGEPLTEQKKSTPAARHTKHQLMWFIMLTRVCPVHSGVRRLNPRGDARARRGYVRSRGRGEEGG